MGIPNIWELQTVRQLRFICQSELRRKGLGGLRLQRGGGEFTRRWEEQYMENNRCHAIQISLSGVKIYLW